MALHSSLVDLLSESLPEYVAMAEHAITTSKPGGGCYGYPAAALLFAVADAIGSYCAGNDEFKVDVGGKMVRIGSGEKSFYVLNGRFYGLALSSHHFESLYKNFRGPLTHNAAMVPGLLLEKGNVGDPVFHDDPSGQGVICLSLVPFLEVSKRAVEQFLKSHGGIVPTSGQWKDLAKKAGKQ